MLVGFMILILDFLSLHSLFITRANRTSRKYQPNSPELTNKS